MATLIDYVRCTQQTFAEKPFGTADSLVLAQLTYLHMPPIVPRLVLPDDTVVDTVATVADGTGTSTAEIPDFLASDVAHHDPTGADADVTAAEQAAAGIPKAQDAVSIHKAQGAEGIPEAQSAVSIPRAPGATGPQKPAAQRQTGRTEQTMRVREVSDVPTPAVLLPQHDPSVWDPYGPTPVPLHELGRAEWLRLLTGESDPHTDTRRLLETVLESRRFRDVRVSNAIEPMDVRERNRFAALTYDLGDGTMYIAFRGTDGTFAGWHEDYRLLFIAPPLPSQAQAARYTKKVLEGWRGAIILGGHSMGGNLAAYVAASAPVEVQGRIAAVYEHDSPGFIRPFLASPGFVRVRGRIHKTVPESSMIGMLFDSGVEETIVRSAAHGLSQHHMTSWLFDDDTLELSRGTRLNRYSSAFAKLMNDWRENLSVEDRRRFIDDLFDALYSTGVSDFPSLMRERRTALPRFREAIRTFPPDEQQRLKATLGVLVQIVLDRASGGRLEEKKDGKKDQKKDAGTTSSGGNAGTDAHKS